MQRDIGEGQSRKARERERDRERERERERKMAMHANLETRLKCLWPNKIRGCILFHKVIK